MVPATLRAFSGAVTVPFLHRRHDLRFPEPATVQIQPVDLTEIVAVVMGVSIVLIPVAGLTLRFAIKPVVEAIGRSLESHGLEDTVGVLERRMEILERQLESTDTSVGRLAEAVEFQKELQAGRSSTPLRTDASDHSES